VSERVRTLLRAVKSGHVAAALLLVAIAAIVVPRLGDAPPGQRAVGQEATEEATVPLDPGSESELPAPDLPPALDQYLAEEEPTGIPGLSVMDVIGRVGMAPPGVVLSCTGATPERGEVYLWRCQGSAGSPTDSGAPAEYRVEVIGDDPNTILSVTASAYRATDAQAADFLAYVGGLAVEEPSPLEAEVWIRGNLASGDSTSSDGAALDLYGYDGARVLQVVATGL
jgi:hypothetical protein